MGILTASRLHQAIVDAGVPIVGVSIGIFGDKSTYLTQPSTLQSAAQATINAFDDSPAADAAAQQQQLLKQANAIFGVRKSADEATSSNAFGNCADLAFTLAPNTSYYFRFEGAYTSALATTGLQLSVNGPASPTFLAFGGQIAESVTAVRNGVAGSYDVAIAGTGSAAATPLPFWISGSITTGATGGLFTLRMRSEVNASAVTVKRGSVGQLIVVA